MKDKIDISIIDSGLEEAVVSSSYCKEIFAHKAIFAIIDFNGWTGYKSSNNSVYLKRTYGPKAIGGIGIENYA